MTTRKKKKIFRLLLLRRCHREGGPPSAAGAGGLEEEEVEEERGTATTTMAEMPATMTVKSFVVAGEGTAPRSCTREVSRSRRAAVEVSTAWMRCREPSLSPLFSES